MDLTELGIHRHVFEFEYEYLYVTHSLICLTSGRTRLIIISPTDHLVQKPTAGDNSLHTLGLLGGKSHAAAANSALSPTTELPIDG